MKRALPYVNKGKALVCPERFELSLVRIGI